MNHVIINWLLAWLACLDWQFRSLTVLHKKWCDLPTHKPKRDWAEKLTRPSPSLLFVLLWVVHSRHFYFVWTDGEAQTNQQCTYFTVNDSVTSLELLHIIRLSCLFTLNRFFLSSKSSIKCCTWYGQNTNSCLLAKFWKLLPTSKYLL